MNIKHLMKEHVRKNIWQYLLITAIFGLGFILGEINVSNLEGGARSHLVELLDRFLEGGMITYQEGYKIFVPAFSNQAKTTLMIWFLGMTVVGVPFILAIVFVKGFSLGFTFGFLVKEKAVPGFLIFMLSVFPQNSVYVPFAIAWAVMGINFSIYLVKGRFAGGFGLGQGVATYTGVMLILLVVFLFGALIESFLSPWLLELVMK